MPQNNYSSTGGIIIFPLKTIFSLLSTCAVRTQEMHRISRYIAYSFNFSQLFAVVYSKRYSLDVFFIYARAYFMCSLIHFCLSKNLIKMSIVKQLNCF